MSKSITTELAKAANGKVKTAKRNQRIMVEGKTAAIIWTRSNGSLAIYAQGKLKPAGELKKHTKQTSEGTRLKVTTDELAASDLGLATELVKLAADHVREVVAAAKPVKPKAAKKAAKPKADEAEAAEQWVSSVAEADDVYEADLENGPSAHDGP